MSSISYSRNIDFLKIRFYPINRLECIESKAYNLNSTFIKKGKQRIDTYASPLAK